MYNVHPRVHNKVQMRAAGMVSGLKGRTYEERLKELGMCTLAERRHQSDMLQVYKILTGKDKVRKDTWFISTDESGRETRETADPLNLRLPVLVRIVTGRFVT